MQEVGEAEEKEKKKDAGVLEAKENSCRRSTEKDKRSS